MAQSQCRGNSRMNFRLSSSVLFASVLACHCTGPALHAQADPTTVRLATVSVPANSGLLAALLPEFERQTGYRVEVTVANQEIYDIARSGAADLVISHYGFPGVEAFVLQGLGRWPRPVFASPSAVLGPPADPAQIGCLTDATEAFRRIAQTGSPFVVNNDPAVKYLIGVLWEGAGRPDPGSWYLDPGLEGPEAAQYAADLGGYTLWGVDPFLTFRAQHHLNLEAFFSGDSLLQRIMVSIVVDPKTSPDVNVEGARALQAYLVSPAAQARVRAFRYPGILKQLWWPAGQQN